MEIYESMTVQFSVVERRALSVLLLGEGDASNSQVLCNTLSRVRKKLREAHACRIIDIEFKLGTGEARIHYAKLRAEEPTRGKDTCPNCGARVGAILVLERC